MNIPLIRCRIMVLCSCIILTIPVFGQWNRIYDFQGSMMGISFINRDTGFVCGGYQGPALFKTVTGGYTWEDLTATFTAPIMSVHFLTPGLGFLYCHSDFNPGIYATSDGGITWTLRYWWSPYIRSFCFPTPTTGYAISGAMEYVDVLKTTDGGTNWSRIASLTTILPGLGVTQTTFMDETLGYFSTDEGSVYKTTNGGFNWSRVYHSHYYSISGLAFTDPQKGFAAATKKDWASSNNGLLLHTSDGGLHWDSTFFDYGCGAICFTSADTGYLGMDAVYKTVDGGISWNRDTCNYWAGVSRFSFPVKDIGYAIGGNLIYKHDPKVGVALPDLPSGNVINLYPNPVRDHITIFLDSPGSSSCTVDLVDPQGIVVCTFHNLPVRPEDRSVTVDLSRLPAGAYFCRIRLGERWTGRKIVILR